MWRRRDVGVEPSLSTMMTAILPHREKLSDPWRRLGLNRRDFRDRVHIDWGEHGQQGELRDCERSGLAAFLLTLGGLPHTRCADRRAGTRAAVRAVATAMR